MIRVETNKQIVYESFDYTDPIGNVADNHTNAGLILNANDWDIVKISLFTSPFSALGKQANKPNVPKNRKIIINDKPTENTLGCLIIFNNSIVHLNSVQSILFNNSFESGKTVIST